MAVQFTAIPHKNPTNPQAPPTYHARVKSSGRITQRELAERISAMCTLTPADVIATLEAFSHIVPDMLANGQIVDMDHFGRFSLSLKSKGANSTKELKSSHITGYRIIFKPGRTLKKILDNTKYLRSKR